MSLFVDVKYLQLLSPRFEGFHRKSDYLWNCRCFLCGDSQKTRTKMRGYFFRLKDHLIYKCHNCQHTTSISTLLKHFDTMLYREYLLETYGDSQHRKSLPKSLHVKLPMRLDIVQKTQLEHAERCDFLPEQHYCCQYLIRRALPRSVWSHLYFTNNYQKVIERYAPKEVGKVRPDARLLIPFYDEFHVLTAFSGRALEASSELRYITIRTTSSDDKLVYGLDRMTSHHPLIIVEGPLDSLFFENAIASSDANLTATATRSQHTDMFLVFDNERRNKEIVRAMKQAIQAGYRVMFWPDSIQGKDINEMILYGYTAQELTEMIYQYSACGLSAQTKLAFWKKVNV